MSYRVRRSIVGGMILLSCTLLIAQHPAVQQQFTPPDAPATQSQPLPGSAGDVLESLPVKGRAAKTDYARTQFGSGWTSRQGCDTRNVILARDLVDVASNELCQVISGTLHDPYTGESIAFMRGAATSARVQIDHVVALSNAWQTGAQALPLERRVELANDPLELLAVDGPANQQKSDGDAATWLPSHKPFRCQYVARQIAVKAKYELWVTPSEKDAMVRVLELCPGFLLPLGEVDPLAR